MPNRKHPIHGLDLTSEQTLIVFLTVCTKDRKPWLASEEVHHLLCDVWKSADAWLVGRYVVMPDHIHLFATPGSEYQPLDNWVRFWKSKFSKAHKIADHRWQTDHWDTRMRSWEKYEEKWIYVRDNPVRHGLVVEADQWPYQGQLNDFWWD